MLKLMDKKILTLLRCRSLPILAFELSQCICDMYQNLMSWLISMFVYHDSGRFLRLFPTSRSLSWAVHCELGTKRTAMFDYHILGARS